MSYLLNFPSQAVFTLFNISNETYMKIGNTLYLGVHANKSLRYIPSLDPNQHPIREINVIDELKAYKISWGTQKAVAFPVLDCVLDPRRIKVFKSPREWLAAAWIKRAPTKAVSFLNRFGILSGDGVLDLKSFHKYSTNMEWKKNILKQTHIHSVFITKKWCPFKQ